MSESKLFDTLTVFLKKKIEKVILKKKSEIKKSEFQKIMKLDFLHLTNCQAMKAQMTPANEQTCQSLLFSLTHSNENLDL